MLDQFKKTIHLDYPNLSDKKIFLAISGGKDSMVLAHLLFNSDLKYELLHCNFQLRNLESEEDEKFVRDFAKELNTPVQTIKFDTLKESKVLKTNTQETARKLRYDWFNKIHNSNQNSIILTAHHLDDSIETFFINLLRGTGVSGIKGINKKRGPYYRPLLEFTSEQIREYAVENCIKFREDSSNASDKYLRNNIRHNVIPILQNIDDRFKIKMDTFFNEVSSLHTWIKSEVFNFKNSKFYVKDKSTTCQLNDLCKLNDYFIQKLFEDYGVYRNNLIEFIQFLTKKTGATFNTKEFRFLINRKELIIEPIIEGEIIKNFIIERIDFNRTQQFGPFKLQLVNGNKFTISPNKLQLDINKVKFPLTLRKWLKGDKIQPFGMRGKKLISDILIDNKIDLFKKESTYIIVDQKGEVIAIPNLLISEKVKIDYTTNGFIEISTV